MFFFVFFSMFDYYQLASGSAFLQKGLPTAAFMNQSVIEQRFLEEVRGFMGKGVMDAQLPEVRRALEPMWLSLPKNSQGRLGNAQVRYALHRYFAKRHGWHLDGLDRTDAEASPSGIMKERVPLFLMDLFEEAFGSSGLMLHELAIFATTLERIIHDEAKNRLNGVYKALANISESFGDIVVGEAAVSTRLSEHDAQEVVKVYMMMILLGQDKLNPETGSLAKHQQRLSKDYPAWSDTLVWLRDIRDTVAYLDEGKANPFAPETGMSLQQVERVVEHVSDGLGSFQDTECRRLKDLLMESEHMDSGRVLLSDFYKKGMETTMQFVERPEYLRQLGALDETRAGEPRVVIPNYILGKGNCLADMDFYSICCINECDALMGQLERTIAAPQASPERITAVLANLSTSTVEATGELSPKMSQRLNEVAARNGGRVPLHSRLFAQWLHFLFPRECPSPHMAGTHNPLTPAEWQESTSENPIMKKADRQKYIIAAAGQAAPLETFDGSMEENNEEKQVEMMRWSDEEEILYLPLSASNNSEMSLFKFAFTILAICGIVLAAVDFGRRSGALNGLGLDKSEKAHLV